MASIVARYEPMKLISEDNYLAFRRTHDSVIVDDNQIVLEKESRIEMFQPEGYRPEEWTV
ncbi:MAG: hypothetical protein JRN23_00230 [Nitrososphaerota archaeon]|nr:hypothetical protein [Nitrososphaerota archaeon]